MGREYEYDETGGAFGFFMLSLLSLYLLPATYYRLKGFAERFKKPEDQDSKSTEEKMAEKRSEKKLSQKPTGFPWRHVIYAVSLLLFAYFAYAAVQQPSAAVLWDPYAILEVPQGASEADIKATYKKLSLKWHPDKNKGNEDFANEKFTEIAKAYKTLTDTETRENWEKYGNPDGRMEFSVGIALPKWISQKENKAVVLGFYFLALVGIVFILWRWWSKSKNYIEDVHRDNMPILANQLYQLIAVKRKKSNKIPMLPEEILRILSLSPEFSIGMKTLPTDEELIAEYSKDKYKNFVRMPKNFSEQYALKALIILNIHVHRLPVPAELKDDYTFVVSKSIPLLTKMIELNAGVKELRDVEAILKTLELQQRVLQAVWDPSETKAQFLQLPHFEDKFIQAFQAKRKTKDQIDTIAKLQALPEEERRSLLKTLTQPQYESMMEAARQIPRVTITKAQFLVMNEDEIYAGDVLTLVIKFFVSYKEGPIPKVDLRPAKSKSKDKGDESDGEEVEKRRQKTDRKYVLPAFTPQYPEARDSSWWVILGQKEKLTFATPLKELTTLNVIEEGVTLRASVQFQWEKAGLSAFQAYIVSDSYVGLKAMTNIELRQKASLKAPKQALPASKGKDDKEKEDEEEEEDKPKQEEDSASEDSGSEDEDSKPVGKKGGKGANTKPEPKKQEQTTSTKRRRG